MSLLSGTRSDSPRPRLAMTYRHRHWTNMATRSGPGSANRQPASAPSARPTRRPCRRPDASDRSYDREGAIVTDLQFPTSLGISTSDTITLLGRDLPSQLLGKISFGELAYQLITLRPPSRGQARVFEAVLVALADHGFTPTAIAARLTYLSAPDAIQGALAAGLLGGGSRYLGVTEDTGRFLAEVLASTDEPADEAGWDALAERAVTERKAAGRLVPGLGHPVHKQGD